MIGGDFNFPGWDWRNKRLKPKSVYPSLHSKFSEILDDVSTVQIVVDPIRKNNTLQPDKVLRLDILPGVSDHDIVFAEFDLRPIKYSQKPRQIPLYKRANWDLIRSDMALLKDSITIMYDSDAVNVNDMWTKFRDTLQTSAAKHTPHKQSKPKDKHPWIGQELKKADVETAPLLQDYEEDRRSTACSTIYRVETSSPEEIQTGLLELCKGDSDSRRAGE